MGVPAGKKQGVLDAPHMERKTLKKLDRAIGAWRTATEERTAAEVVEKKARERCQEIMEEHGVVNFPSHPKKKCPVYRFEDGDDSRDLFYKPGQNVVKLNRVEKKGED